MNAPTHLWPRRKTLAALDLWGSGATFAAIGEQLGYTRNAVTGRIDRLLKDAWINESELCEMVADGLSFDRIGRTLGCSEEAVAARFNAIRRIIGIQAT